MAIFRKKKRRRRRRTSDPNVINLEKERRAREIDEEIAKQYEEPVEISERTEASMRRRREQRRRRRLVYIVVIVVLLAITAWMARSVVELKMEQKELEAKQHELELKKEELKKKKKTMNDNDYIEEQARQQLKMIKPGEILYVVPDEEGAGGQQTDGTDSQDTESDQDDGTEE